MARKEKSPLFDEEEIDDVPDKDDLPDQIQEYAITSYGADYTADGLVKRINESDIVIPTFQRGYVWNFKRASKFIESLLLGLPVPGVFLTKEKETEQLIVIDGQQRLRTLQYFYEGTFKPTEKEFKLDAVQERFRGRTFKSLEHKERRRLNDAIIHATIIEQTIPVEDNSSIYYIFERLNTGGVPLQSQEIRSAIFSGKLNELLKSLNKNPAWRSIYGKESPRMKDQELILRFFAFYSNFDNYKKPLMGFLNTYMKRNRQLEFQSAEELSSIFTETINFIYHCFQKKAFRPKGHMNAAVFDAVMVGVARRLVKGEIKNVQAFKESYDSLVANAKFEDAIYARSSDDDVVKIRINLATEAFVGIE